MALTSCQDKIEQVTGSYSYKVSGTAVVDSSSVALRDEQGAMELIRVEGENVLLTFNALRGSAYATKGTLTYQTLTLQPFDKSVSAGINEYNVTVTGTGTVYSNTILFDLTYESEKLTAEKVTMICKKN